MFWARKNLSPWPIAWNAMTGIKRRTIATSAMIRTSKLTRRSALALVASSALSRAQSRPFSFGFSLYGMKTVPYPEAIDYVAKLGYECTELCLRPGWNTEPKLLTKADRSEIRNRLGDVGLMLPAVMENLFLGRPGGGQVNLERLRAAAEVCYECSPGGPALIETTVGGRPGSWEQLKEPMATELHVWAKLADELKVTIALKAHSKNAMDLPERLLWLVDQVKSPRVRVVYDYSHFLANKLEMA